MPKEYKHPVTAEDMLLTTVPMSQQIPWLVVQDNFGDDCRHYYQLVAAFRDYHEAAKYAASLDNADVQLIPGLAEQEKKKTLRGRSK